jgi:lipopolysaccharide heptosyltransferase II
MAGAVMRIFKDPGLAQYLAENAYKKVKEKYNVELMVKNTLDIYQEAMNSFKILIIKFSSPGDIILSSPAIRSIRERFKSNGKRYKISFLVGEESKNIMLTCPYIDELLVCDFKNKDRGLLGFLRLAASLRKNNFDMVIDLQNNLKSHLLGALAFALNRYGYDNKKFGFLLNHRIKDEKPAIGPVTHQFRILKMLGIELDNPKLELWPTPQDDEHIKEFLKGEWLSVNQKLVGINISASPRWASKAWPLEHIAKVCEELSKKDMRIVITGTGRDLAQANALLNSVKLAKPINACGKTTINQLACLIKNCSVYISSDSAPLHIAVAVGTPFLALFGPTDPVRHLPPAKNYLLIKKDLSCSPCYNPKCKNRKCMKQITPEEVLGAVDKLLTK